MHSTDKLTIDTPEQISLELPLAGIGSRFLALAVDTLIQFIVTFVAFFIFLATAFTLPSKTYSWIPATWLPAIMILFFFCIYWGYFAFFEIIWKGQTPGKRQAGIRVIKDTGRPINTFEAIARNLMRAVDSLPGMYGIGIVTMILNPQNRRLGDFVAGTVVVHDKAVQDFRPDWMSPARTAEAAPEVAQLGSNELVLIEAYLQRRLELDPMVRLQTAEKIVSLVKSKTGLQPAQGQSDDDFLEAVVQQVRDSARFR